MRILTPEKSHKFTEHLSAEKVRASVSSSLEVGADQVLKSILENCDREHAARMIDGLNDGGPFSVSTACMVVAQLLATVLIGLPAEESTSYSGGILRLALQTNAEARKAQAGAGMAGAT